MCFLFSYNYTYKTNKVNIITATPDGFASVLMKSEREILIPKSGSGFNALAREQTQCLSEKFTEALNILMEYVHSHSSFLVFAYYLFLPTYFVALWTSHISCSAHMHCPYHRFV